MISNKYLFFDNLKGRRHLKGKKLSRKLLNDLCENPLLHFVYLISPKKLILEAFPTISQKSEYQE